MPKTVVLSCFMKPFSTLLKKSLWHRYFPLNFAIFLGTLFLQNTSGDCLLNAFKLYFDFFSFKVFWRRRLHDCFHCFSFRRQFISPSVYKPQCMRVQSGVCRLCLLEVKTSFSSSKQLFRRQTIHFRQILSHDIVLTCIVYPNSCCF